MIRLIGAALVAAGGAWLGYLAAKELRGQVRAVRQMAEGLALLERELELSAPPLIQLLERGAARSGGPARALFQGCLQGMDSLDRECFSALWRRLVPECGGVNPQGQAGLFPPGGTPGGGGGRTGSGRPCPPPAAVWRSWPAAWKRTAAVRAGCIRRWACPEGRFW